MRKINSNGHETTTTRQGNPVVIVTKTSKNIIANVYPVSKFGVTPTQMKFNLDGTLYCKDIESPFDLMLA